MNDRDAEDREDAAAVEASRGGPSPPWEQLEAEIAGDVPCDATPCGPPRLTVNGAEYLPATPERRAAGAMLALLRRFVAADEQETIERAMVCLQSAADDARELLERLADS